MTILRWSVSTISILLFAFAGVWPFAGSTQEQATAVPLPGTTAPQAPAPERAPVPEQPAASHAFAPMPAPPPPPAETPATPAVPDQPAMPAQTVIPTAAAPMPSPAPQQTAMPEQAAVPEQATVLERPPIPIPDEPPENDSAPGQAVARPEAAPGILLPVPPRSLQTLVDERRDALRERRNARLDEAYGSPRQYMPPWFSPYDDAVERYRDARRSFFRQQRDWNRQRHNGWMDALCPWSKPRRDWSAQRSYQRQMEQLDQQEWRDAYVPRGPFAYPGPTGW